MRGSHSASEQQSAEQAADHPMSYARRPWRPSSGPPLKRH
ncbi:hypothetical protein BN2364_2244 [Alloalcanivorax xenomutans]|nr:hypothetical protein BN2364_2244 [Alloalcanivorax xenomutans]